MIRWKVIIQISYYDVEWIFYTAEEAAEFAKKAIMGRTEKGEPVSVQIIGVFPKEEKEEEQNE